MKRYQVFGEKLNASATFTVTAKNLYEANKALTALLKLTGMTYTSPIEEL